MTVKEIMTKEVITVSPGASLKEIGEILKEKRISGVPVVEEGKILGVITLTDLLRILNHIYEWKNLESKMKELNLSEMFEEEKLKSKASDLMSRDVFTLNEDDSLDEVMRLMFAKKIHTLPVVKDGALIGIVGKRDLIYACF